MNDFASSSQNVTRESSQSAAAERASAKACPVDVHEMALFLDLDGTLLDIAATPEAVVVPGDLVADLDAASSALGGALAIVSGRALGDVDSLLAPLCLPAAGEHGAVIRFPDGERDEYAMRVPDDWIEALSKLRQEHRGIMIERKTRSVVVHFRNAPHEEAQVRELAADIVSRDPARFTCLPGKMVVEIVPRDISKGHAVRKFMQIAPFRGRRPVFVGDDVTDEYGFEAALEFGGMGLHVAECFGGRPQAVRRWLKQLAQT